MKMLRELVRKRLMAAADEIFQLFERTIASYEEELSRAREAQERHRKHVNMLRVDDIQQLISHQEERPPRPQNGGSTLEQEDPQPPYVKEEGEELWITQEGDGLLGSDVADLTKLPLTVVCVKIEDHEEKPAESSQRHYSQGEESRGAEPPQNSSLQHMAIEADKDRCGASRFTPKSDSDDTASLSDRDNTQESLSSNTDCEGDMRTHSNKHSKKTFTCSVCAKSFSDKRDFARHTRTHTGEKPFCCSVCGQRFSEKSNMGKHMRTHTGEKPFSCSICGRRFAEKSNIIPHMRRHTGERPFTCSVCGQRFSEKSNMVKHMRRHTGETPYSCSICGKKFSQHNGLTAHTRTHTGEKPFGCSVCGERFSQKSNMESHMRTHTGERPYSCWFCPKTFAQHSNLMVHTQIHSRK
ncbi:uncharacterized protein [Nerophis lumbriciformis]|uniref:uncharacterized protein n=1 Tax=Nerophis lumbriciformis TaxID=546530 RepID=UPI002AE0841A|nr:zinc finger protein OZF-like [Nerophis lumbriciformis]